MPNIIDILARALSLRQETELNSITPNRAGGIMYDTLLVLNQMQLEGGSLLISKVYASVSAMEADTTPTSDLTGRALKPGQLVVIVTSDSSSSDMGSEYRFNGPGSWTYVGKVGGLPLDTVPTQSSTKGITSGGVYTALAAMKAEGYKYMGLATPGSGGTAPGTPNQPVFYIAGHGSYPNFGSITVASGYLGFIKYSGGSWSVESVAVGKDYDEQISSLNGQISQLEAKAGRLVAGDIFSLPGYYKHTTGEFIESASYKATPLLKLRGQDIRGHFYLPSSASTGSAIFYNENKQFISSYYAASSGTIDRTIPTTDFPANAAYIAIVTAASKLSESWLEIGAANDIVLSDIDKDYAKGLFDSASGDISELSSKTLPAANRYKDFGRELFTLDGEMYSAQSGNLASNAAYLGTEKLEISGAINGYFYMGGNSYQMYGVSFYDQDKAFISGYSGITAGKQEVSIPVSSMPAGAKYFAVSTVKSQSSDATLVCGWTGAIVTAFREIANINQERLPLDGKKILVFGDSLVEFIGPNDNKTWCQHAAEISGATFINVGIGGTRLSSRVKMAHIFDASKTYSVDDLVYYLTSGHYHFYRCTQQHSGAWDSSHFTEITSSNMYVGLDLVNLVTMACDTNTSIELRFADAEAAADCVKTNVSSHDDNTAQVERLKNVDFSTIDAIMIMAGTNDYANAFGNSDSDVITEENGAINTIVGQLSTAYGTIPIYFIKEPVKWFPHTVEGETVYTDDYWCDVYTRDNMTLTEYFDKIEEQFKIVNHIPVCDLYYGLGWNKQNFWNFFRIQSDGTHPYYGFRSIAEKVVSFIIANKLF